MEGDNLEALKLLQKPYHKKVKMIYIDPPYNTGKEFIYPDNYKDNLNTYLEYTGQKDAEGRKFSSNSDSTGRYHTNWLNMMYPRLKLARNLLKDDGVIFISIDDNEQANLKKLCDEMFGEENFVGNIIWKNVTDNNPTNIATEHESIVVFAKNKDSLENTWKSKVSKIKDILVELGNQLTSDIKDKSELQVTYSKWFRENKNQLSSLDRYKYIDNDGVYTGSQSVHNPGKEGYRYDILHPSTNLPCKQPLMGYRFPEETIQKLLQEGKILFGEDHNKIIELKVYAKDYVEKLSSVIELDGRLGAYDLKHLFPEVRKLFTNPKPVSLLSKYISFSSGNDALILDFFSGSSTSAHSVMDLNAQDNGSRKYIMVQLPETCDEKTDAFKAGYNTIADIGKERIRRAGEKILSANQDKDGIESLDIGFKVFKLDSSNIKAWDIDEDNIQQSLLDAIDNIKPEREPEDVLYEVLLKYGLDLTLPIEERCIAGKTLYSIGFGALVVCLDDNITLEVIEGIGQLKEELDPEVMKVVFLDNGFADPVVKTNALQILKRYTIDDVKSI
ncbi:site-specific DNA-methyltransferase [Methylococcaceae bacterium CS1]|nr:site-specific DNA-methyltransferase [Methylococcaceae bacterium CS1]